jgi:uncharacterized protein (DUF2235 family)
VVKLASGLAPRDTRGRDQIVYYEPGIGAEGVLDPWVRGFTGIGLSRTIKGVYTFLVNNYEPDDLVYCFGFSRGAFIVRSLTGLIGKVGLLKKQYVFLYNEAYDMYRREDLQAESPDIHSFRKDRVHPDPLDDEHNPSIVHLLGVWDTVGALGIPVTGIDRLTSRRFSFHDVTLNPHLPYAYQALAIDERREAYAPALWKRSASSRNRDVQQVWFAGVHANVGGGYEDTGLANIAFIWMVDRARACGLAFDEAYIREKYFIAQNHRGELRDSVSGIFSALPKQVREIGAVGEDGTPVITGEHVHQSALLRRQEMGEGYAPTNLPPDIEGRLPVVSYTAPA